MKKIVVIFLIFIYGFSTIGATVHLHYCMNELVGWSLWHGAGDSKCGKCGMKEKKGGCCKDEHKQFKLKTDHQKYGATDYSNFSELSVLLTPLSNNNFTLSSLVAKFNYNNYHPPPNIHKNSLQVLYCSFLI